MMWHVPALFLIAVICIGSKIQSKKVRKLRALGWTWILKKTPDKPVLLFAICMGAYIQSTGLRHDKFKCNNRSNCVVLNIYLGAWKGHGPTINSLLFIIT